MHAPPPPPAMHAHWHTLVKKYLSATTVADSKNALGIMLDAKRSADVTPDSHPGFLTQGSPKQKKGRCPRNCFLKMKWLHLCWTDRTGNETWSVNLNHYPFLVPGFEVQLRKIKKDNRPLSVWKTSCIFHNSKWLQNVSWQLTRYPPLLTSSGGHRNAFGLQVGGTHPTAMLPCK